MPAEFLSAAASSISVLAVIYVVSNFGAAFEAIVMGGHRIDLTRKYSTVLNVCEAVVIIRDAPRWLWTFGHDNRDGYFGTHLHLLLSIEHLTKSCHEMRISIKYFTTSVFPELIRFAGSYQLVNVLELAVWGEFCQSLS